jgi:hypothetical protein
MSRLAGRTALLTPAALASFLTFGSPTGAELSAQAPAPREPTARPSGGASPFRGPGVKGTSFQAASLEQPGCPIHVSIDALRRTEHGVTLTVRISNLVDGPITRQVVGLWVLVSDGTVRGYQRLESDRPLNEAESRVTDLRIRTVDVMPNDLIVVAVEEARGDTAWRREQLELEMEIRRALVP